jgi:hypothetical protein
MLTGQKLLECVLVLVLAGLVVAEPTHTIVHGGPPCSKSAYLAPTPRTVAAFQAQVEESPEVHLVRLRDDTLLSCRQLASTWEKLVVLFKDKVRLVEYDITEPMGRDIAEYLNVTGGDSEIPYLHLFDGRVVRQPQVNGEACSDSNAGAADSCGTVGLDGLPRSSGDACAGPSPARAAPIPKRSRRANREPDPQDPPPPPDFGLSLVLLRGGHAGHASIKNAINERIGAQAQSAEGYALKRLM